MTSENGNNDGVDNTGEVFIDESDIINEYEVDEEELPDADEGGGSDGEEVFDEVDDSTHIFTGHTGQMQKSFSLLHTVATAGVFSAVSFWYGFMFGRESARKELGDLIETLRKENPNSNNS